MIDEKDVQPPLPALLMEYGWRMARERLVLGSGGNLSAREGGRCYIKEGKVSLFDVTDSDFVPVDIASGQVEGNRKPSSEVDAHLACYRVRDDIGAVMHAHPTYSVAFSLSRDVLPTVTTECAIRFPHGVPVIPYISPGTTELGQVVGEQIRGHDAVLLAHHGVIAVGADLESALLNLQLVEETAKVFLLAELLGEPKPLTSEQVTALLTGYQSDA